MGSSMHLARRTFITKLTAKGTGVRVLMSLAGHGHIGATQAYIDVNEDIKGHGLTMILKLSQRDFLLKNYWYYIENNYHYRKVKTRSEARY